MSPTPTFQDWNALRLAVVALIAAGVTGQAKAFLKAVREAKAAALVLLFALARSLWTEDDPPSKARRAAQPRLARLGGFRLEADADAWRNPGVAAYRLEAGRCASPPPQPPQSPDPPRLEQRIMQGFQTLQRLLSLCDDPEAHALRLWRRLDRADVTLAAAEAKAFGVNARAQARRNREARRLIDQSRRGRRRRQDSG